MGGEEQDFVRDAFDSNWIAPLGPNVDAFEEEFSKYVGTPNAAALVSGTAALHLGMRWLNIQQGDEVLCSSLTFSASVNPVLYERGTPIFVDSDERSWNMDPILLGEAVENRIKRGKKPKAVILVHLYGQCADIDPISTVCEQHGIPLIEDAAEALGALYFGEKNGVLTRAEGIHPGTVGLCGIFSFNGNKIITTSGGGMLVSKDSALIAKARFWATQARDPAPHYQHSEVGFNYRLSNVLAGIGRGQLRVLRDRIEARRTNFDHYKMALGGLPGVAFMPEASYGRCTRWLTCITVKAEEAGISREAIRDALEKENIEARPVWKPMHLQPIFAGSYCYGGSVSERLFAEGLCLPSGSNLLPIERERVIEVIHKVFECR